MAHSQDRRSFLRWATHGLGLVFTAILGFPAVAYLIDPRHRKGASADLRLVDGARLDDPQLSAGLPIQGVIRDVRVDGWTLHPSDVLGRVWVVKDAQAPNGHRVFTTICPHLGCSVNLATDCFACPCHGARFTYVGAQILPNPALRGMDELDWEPDADDPQLIRVRYQNFEPGKAEKKAVS